MEGRFCCLKVQGIIDARAQLGFVQRKAGLAGLQPAMLCNSFASYFDGTAAARVARHTFLAPAPPAPHRETSA